MITYKAILLTIAVLGMQLHAQGQSNDTIPSRQLDEITVTAQKQTENLQEVPVSVSHITEEDAINQRLWQTRDLAGLFPIENQEECTAILGKLANDPNFRNKTGMICGHFVNKNTGATKKIMARLLN